MSGEKALCNMPVSSSNAVDLSHHLSELSKAHGVSPLKGLAKYFGRPGLISLAGGMPHPSYFPLESSSAEVLLPTNFAPTTAVTQASPSSSSGSFSWLWKMLGVETSTQTKTVTVPKYPTSTDEVNLASALQYGTATGIVPLKNFIQEFSARVYQPAYNDFATLVDVGSTDGWSKVVLTLCNPGEGILVDTWTYPSAVAFMLPVGVKPVPVKLDMQGMIPSDLRTLLSEWNEDARGMPRPHVMYSVPVGENPTGMTMGALRKKEVYDICVEFDVIIVEDDPYYFLQEGVYVPKWERAQNAPTTASGGTEQYLEALVPSFLKFDYQGRVIRLDTFSKTIAPGSRLGWFTCNPLFAERLERQGETSTQAPCGFGQAFIASLLLEWKYDGYVRWLQGLGAQYTQRRDFFIDCFAEDFHLERQRSTEPGLLQGLDVYTGYDKSSRSLSQKAEKAALMHPMISFVPPTAGMFLWITIHFEHHPLLATVNRQSLEMRLWTALAEAGVLVAPGWMFAGDPALDDERDHKGHFRMSFSNAEYDNLRKAVKIFSQVLRSFYMLA